MGDDGGHMTHEQELIFVEHRSILLTIVDSELARERTTPHNGEER